MKSLDAARRTRLLVLCSRPDPGPGAGPEVRGLLSPRPDWELLLRRADEEGVLPLLYWNLRRWPEEVPPDVLDRLKVSYLRNLARNSQISRELEPLLRAIKDSGLGVVLTKGLRLASNVYPDMGLRPFWDVDFLVHPADWWALEKILAGLGFEETPDTGMKAGLPAPDRDWTYSPYFRRGGLVLEFHFNILGLHFPVGPEPMGRMTAAPMAVCGAEVAILSPEHELCYLCLHAQQHSYQRLIWLADIAELASRPGIDWGRVFAACGSLKIRASVHHGLRLAEKLWPGAAPRNVLLELRPRSLERAALRFFWPEAAVAGREAALPWPYYMPSLFSLWERRSLALAARTLSGIFFPPRPWLARASGIPGNSFLIYYQYARRLSRPVGLAVRRLAGTS
jgi:hypothetical protein